ncbi:MAG: serine hydrolase [Candidatus Latescibacteria bacterium]|nr:serine hydrolase [Candidatus Latescibacterota bacterium]NIM22204.1 serine hydrolase [Candidatus Latescibacterota bacterium]NIM66243.1 serine hydrolase [Candidatus Latescibacterota bacterium]NIO02319.1 serine hydrolase [Candidatus Latescibacterota bacterium]NIO29850.1 serine hydrolase [Candidatus Latescibacterota bacterium]
MKKTSAIAITLFALVFQIGRAQTPGEISYHDESVMPKGKMGERIQSIISTVNSNDAERIRRFMNEECTEKFRDFAPMDRHITVWRSVYMETGGLDFHSIRTYVPERKDETVVILKDRNYEAWRGLIIVFADKKDYLVDGLQFTPARPPSNVDESELTESLLIKQVESLMKGLIERDVFSGAVLVAKGDDVLLVRAGGEASKRFHVPNTIDTKFNLGSMNKMFTSTAIVQLVEKGMLSFNDPISKYVDESWLPRDITAKIKVHHLLTHTSGLGSYFNETFSNGSRALYRNLEDYKPLVKDEKPEFEPGERWRYSNTGMFLLGVVIEGVTGQNYFDYIRKNIYEPAGMKNTDCYEMDYPVENLAIGYSPDPESEYGWQNNYYKHVVKGGPAGGGFSTVGDLHRFARALLQGKLVSRESLEAMWKDQSGEGYGYGFRIEEGPSGKVVGHGGGFPGINGNLDIFIDRGYTVAVLSNVDRGASPLASRIKELLGRVK